MSSRPARIVVNAIVLIGDSLYVRRSRAVHLGPLIGIVSRKVSVNQFRPSRILQIKTVSMVTTRPYPSVVIGEVSGEYAVGSGIVGAKALRCIMDDHIDGVVSGAI